MTKSRVLYLISCAASPTRQVRTGVEKARAAGWDVCLVLTPSAARWLEGDMPELERLTGHPVRSTHKMPDEPDVLPPADAMVVAPATFNTLNKWAAGISDTLVMSLVNEALGLRLPLVALPHLSDGQAAHPAFARSVSFLRECGVTVLLDENGRPLAAPDYPWDAAFAALPTL
ncbi:flavoprotein [Streptomyces sp. ISL-11]|uniref:flavoprotein n=1 Tax=Streptomyces sp. ISL-11 TaxID=2819174 RepID=UPI001BEADF5E|nr:flavoprotein [Streptomyces sp. ISL-11]MBT2385673.1 flavoprotein [Streptomyces sp. ISL-11]